MFPAVLELQPGTRYLLSLSLAEEREDTVSTDQVEISRLCLYGIRTDSFCTWKPPLCHKDTAKGQKCTELCIYAIRAQEDLDQ